MIHVRCYVHSSQTSKVVLAAPLVAAVLCGMALGAGAQTVATPKPQSGAASDKKQQPAAGTSTPPKNEVAKPVPPPAAPKSGEDLTLARLKVSVWRPAGSGPAPLVIFSHGFHGSSRQSVFLMKALAEHGYIVIAPNHQDAYRFGVPNAALSPPAASFANIRLWSDATYRDRGDDIRTLIATLKSDAGWSKLIDWSHVALMGHSLGGYTVLGLAGAWKTWKIAGIRAVVALSPFCTPFIPGKSLAGIECPVMYQGGTLDIGITPSVKRPSGAFDKTPPPAWFVEFARAGHFAWTDLNPEFQADISYYTVAFLDRYVKGETKADLMRRMPHVADIRSREGAQTK